MPQRSEITCDRHAATATEVENPSAGKRQALYEAAQPFFANSRPTKPFKIGIGYVVIPCGDKTFWIIDHHTTFSNGRPIVELGNSQRVAKVTAVALIETSVSFPTSEPIEVRLRNQIAIHDGDAFRSIRQAEPFKLNIGIGKRATLKSGRVRASERKGLERLCVFQKCHRVSKL